MSKNRRRGNSSTANQRLPPKALELRSQIQALQMRQQMLADNGMFFSDQYSNLARQVSDLATEFAVHAYPERVEYMNRRPERRRRNNLRSVEDRRRHHPDRRYRPALSFGRWRSTLKAIAFGSAAMAAFNEPSRVAICVRRKIRREVMFARGKTGRRGQKRPKFNWFSRIACRRY